LNSFSSISKFFMTPSFEPRSITALEHFIANGGNNALVSALNTADDDKTISVSLDRLAQLNVTNITKVDRYSSKDLWHWVWDQIKDVFGDIIIDATCFNREILSMLLFALSIKRESLKIVYIQYVSAGSQKYATQNIHLQEGDRWLSRGIVGIRSIVGYPGNFSTECIRRVVALAGHELPRLLEAIEFIEPDELSINSEHIGSSTVEKANELSTQVAQLLKEKIQVPRMSDFSFYADSIDKTYESLEKYILLHINENISIIPMNTKLSTIAAALVALKHRGIRLIYVVPEEYNLKYSSDIGDLKQFDITSYIMSAKTEKV
jgi:hypothetical protein